MLPSDIISEILARLPVKTLLQFRCVSRTWRSIIDSQSCIKMHLHQSTTTNSYHSLILESPAGKGLYSVDLELLDKAHVIKPPVSYKGFDSISNSCNGLILVMNETPVPPLLWNPFSRKYKILPDAPIEYPEPLLCLSQVFYGLGYDSRNDDYKVVRVVEFCSETSPAYVCWSATEIYSLKSNSWNRAPRFPYPLPYINANCKKWDVHVVHGALHTLVEESSPKSFRIKAFSVEDKNHYEHYEVMLPPNIQIENVKMKLDVLGGYLSLVSASNSGVTDIWVMKEYRVEESWTQLLSVGSPSISSFWESSACLKPLAYSKNGEEVLLSCDKKRLVWYNLSTKTIRNVNISGLPNEFYHEVCVQSLVCPSSQRGVDEVKNRGREKWKGKMIKREDFLSEGSSSCTKISDEIGWEKD